MTNSEFQSNLSSICALPSREGFETALYELYRTASPSQRGKLREVFKHDSLGGTKPWKNPTDSQRSDLTREQRMRQSLIAMSIRNGGKDHRDDLMSIAYCYHNLALLGVDAEGVLKEIAEISAPEFAGVVLNFARRSAQEKSMEAFGLRITHTPEGPAAEFSG